jgi:hypothetical protein
VNYLSSVIDISVIAYFNYLLLNGFVIADELRRVVKVSYKA